MESGKFCSKRIYELCRERNLSVNKLCKLCGVTQFSVENIITGRSKNPTVGTIIKICNGLGITVNDFFNSYDSNKFSEIRKVTIEMESLLTAEEVKEIVNCLVRMDEKKYKRVIEKLEMQLEIRR